MQDTKRRWLAREAELKRVVSAAPMEVRPIQPSRAALAVPQSVVEGCGAAGAAGSGVRPDPTECAAAAAHRRLGRAPVVRQRAAGQLCLNLLRCGTADGRAVATSARRRLHRPHPAAPWRSHHIAAWTDGCGANRSIPRRPYVCAGGWMNASQLARALRRVQARLEREAARARSARPLQRPRRFLGMEAWLTLRKSGLTLRAAACRLRSKLCVRAHCLVDSGVVWHSQRSRSHGRICWCLTSRRRISI